MDAQTGIDCKNYVAGLVARSRTAQAVAENFTQERVDELVAAIVWEIVKEGGPAVKIAEMAVNESGMGTFEAKLLKLMIKPRGALRDMKGARSVGVIERDDKKGIVKIAKPAGVIGAVVPCTQAEATPVVKSIMALKGRNSIILSPHPRTKNTNTFIVNLIRKTLQDYDAPADLVICIEEPTLEITNELMRQCDLILATGGGGMVKAANSSGTPAYGVGQGNGVVVVDETADLGDAANKIMLSKTFDYATSCSSENSLVVQEAVYAPLLDHLIKVGGYKVNSEEKIKLQKAMWVNGGLSGEIICQSLPKIAKVAGLAIPEDRKFIMVEETGIGPDYPFSGEKLSMVLTIYKYGEFSEAIDKVNAITNYHGKGHSCSIHSFNEDHIMEYALKTKTSRLMVRQSPAFGNSGAWTNGMPMTMTLGCGSWGNNISSDNITWRKLINVTWVSTPIVSTQPTDEELFGALVQKDKCF